MDRERRPVEIDIAARLADGRVLSGAIKWAGRPVDVSVHIDHLAALQRLAAAGVAWAHDAMRPDAPLLYVASRGFSPRFRQGTLASREQVWLWSLEEMYA